MLMKRFLFINLTLISLISCQKTLSCDPVIDAWAKENLEYYSNAGRNEIVALSMSRQMAIYRGLTSEKKVELWKAKKHLVHQSGILSEAEYNDYSRLFDYMKPYHYDSAKGMQELRNYAGEWKALMQDKYSWDEEKLFVFSHIWMTRQEFLQAILCDSVITKGNGAPGTHGDGTCDCSYSIYCQTSGLGRVCSDKDKCKQGDGGCGIVGSSNCTGICQ